MELCSTAGAGVLCVVRVSGLGQCEWDLALNATCVLVPKYRIVSFNISINKTSAH